MKQFLFVVFCAILGCVVIDASREDCIGALCVAADGKSGAIKVSHGTIMKVENQTVRIGFDEISEKDGDGFKVGNTGSRAGQHSLESFADLGFHFSDLHATTVNGIEAVTYNYSGILPGPGATIVVQIFFFKENGNLSICNEEDSITDGNRTMKFNVDIQNWAFCGANGVDCGDEEGEYIDLTISLQFPRGKKLKMGKEPNKTQNGEPYKPKKIFFDEMKMSLRKSVVIDGMCSSMPENYPFVKSKDGKTFITFRFPRFNTSMSYDPEIDTGYGDPAPAEVTNGTPFLSCSIMLLAFALSAVYILK